MSGIAAAWTVQQVCKLIDVPRRTLALWLREGPARASIAEPRGHRWPVLLSIDDVLEISVIAYLREEDVSMQRVKQIVANLRQHEMQLSDFELVVVQGDEVIGYPTRPTAINIGRQFGQWVLLPIGQFRKQAEAVEHQEIAVGEAVG